MGPPRTKKRARRRRKGGTRGRALPILLGVLGVAVVALVGVLLTRYLTGGAEAPENPVPVAYDVYDSDTISEVLDSREVDSRDLSEGELFERGNDEIDSQGITFTLGPKSLTDDCAKAVWGTKARQALRDAGCTQAARAGYTSDEYVGVATLFNLSDAKAAKAVAAALKPPKDPEAQAPGFVRVPSSEEPFNQLGGGYSVSEATVSGHYLMVTWVQEIGSPSPEERADLTSPLIALSGFQDPLYRRVVQLENAQERQNEQPPNAGAQQQPAPGTNGANPAG